MRGTGLLIFTPEFVKLLLDIRNRGSNRLDFGARRLRSDLTVERDYAVLDIVLYAFLQAMLDESSVQILFDALVQIGVYPFGITFRPRRGHGDLVCPHLRAGNRPFNGFPFRLIIATADLTAQ